jgi:hypothetical protein
VIEEICVFFKMYFSRRMNVMVLKSKSSTSAGDAMREVYDAHVIDTHFILVSGDLVSNMRLVYERDRGGRRERERGREKEEEREREREREEERERQRKGRGGLRKRVGFSAMTALSHSLSLSLSHTHTHSLSVISLCHPRPLSSRRI